MTRAEQTLRVLNLARSTKDCPYSQWQVIVMLAINGPMTHDDIRRSMDMTDCRGTMRKMISDGHCTKEYVFKNSTFTLTPKGQRAAAEIIEGKPLNPI